MNALISTYQLRSGSVRPLDRAKRRRHKVFYEDLVPVLLNREVAVIGDGEHGRWLPQIHNPRWCKGVWHARSELWRVARTPAAVTTRANEAISWWPPRVHGLDYQGRPRFRGQRK